MVYTSTLSGLRYVIGMQLLGICMFKYEIVAYQYHIKGGMISFSNIVCDQIHNKNLSLSDRI